MVLSAHLVSRGNSATGVHKVDVTRINVPVICDWISVLGGDPLTGLPMMKRGPLLRVGKARKQRSTTARWRNYHILVNVIKDDSVIVQLYRRGQQGQKAALESPPH